MVKTTDICKYIQ